MLQKILACAYEIQTCLDNQRKAILYEDKWNWLWGEMDWREEFANLIKEKNGISA